MFDNIKNRVIDNMIDDKNIIKKDIGKNLISLNFSRDSFYNKEWYDGTMRARGLFIDKDTKSVKMRSYNKFFNLNENEFSDEQSLKNAVYPITAYKKYNGFLGIMSVVNGELTLATKSTINGQYVEYFKEIFYKEYYQTIDMIKNVLIKYNCSIMFEVIHSKDQHIVEMENDYLYLLDAIENKIDIGGLNIDIEFSKKVINKIFKKIENKTNIRLKEEMLVANTYEELTKSLNDIETYDIEGVVLTDSVGYMVKYKTQFYLFWKRVRIVKDRIYFLIKKERLNVFNFSLRKSTLDGIENKDLLLKIADFIIKNKDNQDIFTMSIPEFREFIKFNDIL